MFLTPTLRGAHLILTQFFPVKHEIVICEKNYSYIQYFLFFLIIPIKSIFSYFLKYFQIRSVSSYGSRLILKLILSMVEPRSLYYPV